MSALVLPPEDDIGRAVAQELRGQFGSSRRLIALCEDLAAAESGDRVGAIYAAANLLRANAHVANSVARVARIETRHRSISELSQPLNPSQELNSKNLTGPQRVARDDEIRAELERKLQVGFDHARYLAHLDYVASATGIDERHLAAEVRKSGGYGPGGGGDKEPG